MYFSNVCDNWEENEINYKTLSKVEGRCKYWRSLGRLFSVGYHKMALSSKKFIVADHVPNKPAAESLGYQ